MTFPDLLAPANLARRSGVLVAGLLLLAAAGCHDSNDGTGPAPSGTVSGTITSSLGGPLTGIKVTATPTSGDAPNEVTTDGDGRFSVSGVPVSDGKGSIALAELPTNCTDPGDVAYTGLAGGKTVTRDIEVACHELVGTITGTVTSSLGGPLAGLHVSVDPDGDSPAMDTTTDADGRFTMPGVPAGSGSVTVSGFASNCSAPNAATYAQLADGDTTTVDVEVPCAATTGSLEVTITGLVDLDGAVQVTGPNGFDTTLTATATLTDLEPGSYAIAASDIDVDDPVVVSRYIAVITGAPATVVAGDTAAAQAFYAIRTGSGGLWFTNATNGKIARLASGQLHTSGSPADTTSIDGPAAPASAAFDTTGRLWVSSRSGNELVAYTRDQLVAGGTPAATTTITGTALNEPHGIAFDAAGNLWVANRGNGTIVRYSHAQLVDGGDLSPVVTVSSSALSAPVGIALDGAGNLWVADSASNTVLKFSALQLSTGGTITPDVTLSATGGSLAGPKTLAFDAAGKLWVANTEGSNSSIVAFTSTQRAASGAPVPSVTITLSGALEPASLAFDQTGGLWVAAKASSSLLRFAADQLTASGTPTPTVTITAAAGGSLAAPSALYFDPHAPGLPIR